MVVALGVVIGVLGAVLLAMASYGLVMGSAGGLFGERFERCSACGRLGMTQGGLRHPDGCPHPVARASHSVDEVRHAVHLPSH